MAKRILFFGNCQVQALSSWFACDNDDWDVQYECVTSRFLPPTMEPEELFRALSTFDVLVTNPIMNERNGFHHLHLKEAMKGQTVFVPYVYVDGLFSLEISYETWGEKYFGFDSISGLMPEHDFPAVWERFQRGQLNFNNAARLEQTLSEMAAREKYCDVFISASIRASLQDRLPMSTHNHPNGFVLDELLKKTCEIITAAYTPLEDRPETQIAFGQLPPSPRAFTPYDVEILGLRYSHDEDWLSKSHDILQRAWASHAATLPAPPATAEPSTGAMGMEGGRQPRLDEPLSSTL